MMYGAITVTQLGVIWTSYNTTTTTGGKKYTIFKFYFQFSGHFRCTDPHLLFMNTETEPLPA